MSQNLWKGKQDKHPLKTSRSGRTLKRSQKVITSSDDGSSSKKSKTTTEVDEKIANLKEKYATIIANRSSKSQLQILKSIETLSSGITLPIDQSKVNKSKPGCSSTHAEQNLQNKSHPRTSHHKLTPKNVNDFGSNKNGSNNSRSNNSDRISGIVRLYNKSKDNKSKPDCSLATGSQSLQIDGHKPTSFLSPYTLGSPLDFKSNKNDSTNSRSDNLN
ncbi:uncharacterized protein LOC127286358 isoform X1 [Leptopilina boulardi]|uniref:uncharacterized protein LOC127286358 isoform X1 n=1 Tax=Leptopilina boulardi TaxID=63433 RepID=UPI0021F64C16|nr:uncharacterized protein LOC127286358 isoform X1 [Leptopilina boulardi]